LSFFLRIDAFADNWISCPPVAQEAREADPWQHLDNRADLADFSGAFVGILDHVFVRIALACSGVARFGNLQMAELRMDRRLTQLIQKIIDESRADDQGSDAESDRSQCHYRA